MNIKFPSLLVPLMLIGYSFSPEFYYPLIICLGIFLIGMIFNSVIEAKKLFTYGLFNNPSGDVIIKDWIKRFIVGFNLYYFTTFHIFNDVIGIMLIPTKVITMLFYILLLLNMKNKKAG